MSQCTSLVTVMNKSKALMKQLVENAIDFLASAIDEFEVRPKFSIVHFSTAVELFLKARLLHEHWSLVVSKSPDSQKFETGDFESVTFDEACVRLQKVVESPIPDGARKNFDEIRKHRNKMVHFFHHADVEKAGVEAIALEQLRAWYDLNQLLSTQWAPIFNPYTAKFRVIEKTLSKHREYLRAKFKGLEKVIATKRANGAIFIKCKSCRFNSAHVTVKLGDLKESKCLVCNYSAEWFDYECPGCGKISPLYEGGEFTCKCGHTDDAQDIADHINEFVATKDNYYEANVHGNCVECDGYHTIVEYKDRYLCVSCFALAKSLETCGWCGESSNGDMEGSSWSGCSACDGRAGWDSDD